MNPEHDSSSSDDDGNDEKLREALDVRMFSVTKSIPRKNNEYEARGTLVDRYKHKLLDVTPEFQSFVAKRLSDTLDRSIEEFQPKRCRVEPDQSAGIRLFTNSKTLLVDRKFSHDESASAAEPEISARRSKRKVKSLLVKRDVSDELLVDEERKCRDAAVSAEWILSGECTRGWSRPKGAVFAYHKNKDGVLEAEESSPNFSQSRNRPRQTCTYQNQNKNS